jgi:ribosomal protein L29
MPKNVTTMDRDAVLKEVESLRKELFNLKLSKSSGQVKDFSQFKKLRRKIAQCLTQLHADKQARV